MVRLSELPAAEAQYLMEVECPTFDREPWVTGPALAERRVALVSSAGLNLRGDRPFLFGSAGFRTIPDGADPGDVLMSHVSVSYDRTGFQQDLNVVLPLDRLHELAEDGVVGSAAGAHYSFMGATDPLKMEPKALQLAGALKDDGVNAIVLLPV
jgi:D-proline reductase (dithiol) PrdB